MIDQFEKSKSIFNILIPELYKDVIQFLFKDFNESNWEPSNVTYKFKNGPLECPFYPNFFYIPGYSKYVINKDGVIKNIITGKNKSWSVVKNSKETVRGGYVKTSSINDSGLRNDLSRHRALCLTFKDYDKHPGLMIINHKNGIGGDDQLDNLEFCTYSENTKHAYDLGLYSNKVVPIDCLNWKTNEEYSFSSIQSCSDFLQEKYCFSNANLISHRLRYGNNKKYKDGWRFKKKDEEWLTLNNSVGQTVLDRQVAARDIFNDRLYLFSSIGNASRETNINYGTIRTQCEEKTKVPFNGWQFRFIEDFDGWPKYSEEQIAIFKDYPLKPSDGIKVYDIETNKELVFTSPDKAGTHFGLSPITIAKLARYEGTCKNRFKFKLIKIRENY
jgi:hypothetical protein